MTRSARRIVGLAVAVAVLAATHSAARAQSRRPMTISDLAELPRVIFPQLSPDGRTLVYFQSEPDWNGLSAMRSGGRTCGEKTPQ